MKSEFDQLSRTMDALTEVSALPCLWKVSGAMALESRLPLRQAIHQQQFCAAVKNDPELEKRCIYHDTAIISRRIMKEKKPFVCRCHAGVSELVIPLFDDDVCLGTLLCGPLRQEDAICVYTTANHEFARLPECRPEFIKGMELLVPQLLEEIALKAYPAVHDELRKNVRDRRVLQSLDYIDRNFRKKITVEAVAKLCCLSPSRLIHLFKSECGIAFSEYLLRVRLREARHYLSDSDLRIDEVAAAVGFSSQSNFAALFKRSNDITPLHYRTMHRKVRQV